MRPDRPASSAEGVALARALETSLPPERRLFADPFAVRFLGRFGRTVATLCRRRRIRRSLLGAHDRLLPGLRGIAVGRTRAIDDALREALDRGVSQVLNLGAGYDARALRIPGARRARFFEVDHPATQQRKREVLAAALGGAPPHLCSVPVDFERDDLGKALREAGFRLGAPTFCIWEGVTEYLREEAVDAVLRWLRAAVAPGSELVFTYTDRRLIDGTREFRGGRRLLRMNRAGGEPYRFGFAPAELDGALAARGFALLDDAAGREFEQRYFAPLGRGLRGNEYERTARAHTSVSGPG